MDLADIVILHYSSAPVVGGVESVMRTQAGLFLEAGCRVSVVAGNGEKDALPGGAEFIRMPELNSQHPRVARISRELEQGRVPADFDHLAAELEGTLRPILSAGDLLIVHNIFTKHFNLPLTAALSRLLDQNQIRRCVAWCHDFTWTSPHSRAKVHPGYPWDLLRTFRPDVTYVTVSQARQNELAGLFGCRPEQIRVIYNGVDPQQLLGISAAGMDLIDRLGLWDSDLNLLMPVRVTQAKNIELAIGTAAVLIEKGIRPKMVITGPPDPHDEQSTAYFNSLHAQREKAGVEQEVSFVFELGRNASQPFLVDMPLVGDLYRVSDALFMPSHREGFGMPILEAGLAGIPAFSSDQVPAAKEIGGEDVILFPSESGPQEVAALILDWLEHSREQHLRRRVRQRLRWKSIFQHEILKLLEGDPP